MERPQTCLCFVVRTGADGRDEVLLGRKKRGLGAGKVVGLGGHVEPGEGAAQAAARELAEESGLRVDPAALRPVAVVDWVFPARPAWDMWVTAFTVRDVPGEPAETDEIEPAWFPVDAPPLDAMWDDARYWLPQVLAGRFLRARIAFAADCEHVADADVVLTEHPPAP
ncbi:8-oxo-dGTP diphosphatase [Actinacidiphila yeochonensis]|uniref:8-oxo-dGTP diphosphatase n=1 Tax=Actinacidiphila yeochonensis TaxID=89050 RepID=UPI001E4B7593|nr:NUDIX domain-containing protein [Actinacidiphila yeochonensis]